MKKIRKSVKFFLLILKNRVRIKSNTGGGRYAEKNQNAGCLEDLTFQFCELPRKEKSTVNKYHTLVNNMNAELFVCTSVKIYTKLHLFSG